MKAKYYIVENFPKKGQRTLQIYNEDKHKYETLKKSDGKIVRWKSGTVWKSVYDCLNKYSMYKVNCEDNSIYRVTGEKRKTGPKSGAEIKEIPCELMQSSHWLLKLLAPTKEEMQACYSELQKILSDNETTINYINGIHYQKKSLPDGEYTRTFVDNLTGILVSDLIDAIALDKQQDSPRVLPRACAYCGKIIYSTANRKTCSGDCRTNLSKRLKMLGIR